MDQTIPLRVCDLFGIGNVTRAEVYDILTSCGVNVVSDNQILTQESKSKAITPFLAVVAVNKSVESNRNVEFSAERAWQLVPSIRNEFGVFSRYLAYLNMLAKKA